MFYKYILNLISLLLLKILKYFRNDAILLMLGLNYSGKSTILYKLKLDELVSTIPTIGFNSEVITCSSCKCLIYDLGGQEKLRSLWKHYLNDINGLIFVIDSGDRERLNKVKYELNTLRNQNELQGISFLLFANKQDQENSMNVTELVTYLELDKMTERKWNIQSTSAIDGRGIQEGFNWICNNLKY